MSGIHCRKSDPISISIVKKKIYSNEKQTIKSSTGSSLKKSYSSSFLPDSPFDDTPPNSLRSKYMNAFASLYLMTVAGESF